MSRIMAKRSAMRRATAMMIPQYRTALRLASGARFDWIEMYRRLSDPITACRKQSMSRLPRFSKVRNSAIGPGLPFWSPFRKDILDHDGRASVGTGSVRQKTARLRIFRGK